MANIIGEDCKNTIPSYDRAEQGERRKKKDFLILGIVGFILLVLLDIAMNVFFPVIHHHIH